MSTSQLALAVLLLPAAGAILLAGRGWRLPRIVTRVVGPGVGWAPFRSAVLAARKAFVMNVIGDVGMMLGAFVIFVTYHAVTYGAVFAQLKSGTFCPPPGQLTQCLHIVGGDSSSLELAAFLLLVGAVAKSAQLPLHTWLPDAMEGPTPVSAL